MRARDGARRRQRLAAGAARRLRRRHRSPRWRASRAGRSALLANNPAHLGGAIDADAADKAARFMQLCDAYGLPLVSLVDTPGFMVGPEVETTRPGAARQPHVRRGGAACACPSSRWCCAKATASARWRWPAAASTRRSPPRPGRAASSAAWVSKAPCGSATARSSRPAEGPQREALFEQLLAQQYARARRRTWPRRSKSTPSSIRPHARLDAARPRFGAPASLRRAASTPGEAQARPPAIEVARRDDARCRDRGAAAWRAARRAVASRIRSAAASASRMQSAAASASRIRSAGAIRVGVGGWTFEPWRNNFYPEAGRKPRARVREPPLSAIEVNGTYYGTQKPRELRQVARRDAGRFRLLVKASRYATNQARARPRPASRSSASWTAASPSSAQARARPVAVRADQALRSRRLRGLPLAAAATGRRPPASARDGRAPRELRCPDTCAGAPPRRRPRCSPTRPTTRRSPT